ncbi:MAG: acylglycerol kinase family protein, partial [Bacteroidetes bacterium]|nr:acylglycerol kinase family protein [Bacteroidota bacterium]
MKKIAFLVNSVIKGCNKVVSEIEAAFAGDTDIEIFRSAYGGHAEVLASDAVKAGYKYIITVGGDGTINETINGILSCFKTGSDAPSSGYDWEAVSAIRFGVLPRGTGNDFARYFKLSPSVMALKNRILDEKIMKVDVGHTTSTSKDGKPQERFFMNITDVGMGGATVEHMADRRISWLSPGL